METLRLPSVGDWQVRGVANRFPALNKEGARIRSYDGVHRNISAVGYHELLIESPLHNTCSALQPAADLSLVFSAFQQRGHEMAEDPRVEHVISFKNHGSMAGSSMPHPHAQIIGLPIVPSDIRARIEEARRYFDDTGDCVLCTMLAREREDGRRIVAECEHATAFVPYAAFSPFHMWIVPHNHEAHFRSAGVIERQGVAQVLHTILRKLYIGVGNPDFNYVIRSAPVYDGNNEYLHWYVTVVPRLTQVAGFELGADMFINPTLPEESAAFLRSIKV